MKGLTLTLVMILGLASMIVITGCESSDDDTSSTGLSLAPSDVTFAAPLVTNILFTVSNGSGSYVWTVDSPSLGTLVASGSTAIYTSTTSAGTNFIHVTDSDDNMATASIRQQ